VDSLHREPTCSRGENTSAIIGFYRWHAGIYDATRWVTLRGRVRAVRTLELQPRESVLELGCGTGLGLSLLRRGVGAPGSVTGVDCSPHMLKQACRRIRRNRWSNVRLIEQDFSRLDLNCRFDAVAFLYSLSMIADWEMSLERAAHHLAPGGRLLVLDFGTLEGIPSLASPYERWLRANHTEPGRPYAAAATNLFSDVTQSSSYWGYCQVVVARGRRRTG
jgi:S-adenosylmethionine-diacylgycerolhomoserine-N-methlytransferase